MAKIADNECLIRSVLRGEVTDWNRGRSAEEIAAFLAAGRHHGVLPLLDAEFRRRQEFESWPSKILLACRGAALLQAMVELAYRAEIARVLQAFVSAGIAPLLLKGAALAYSHYPSAPLRPRADTDLLIPSGGRTKISRTLTALGYAKLEGVEGEFICHQATWCRTDHFAATHHLDIHWRINNSQILAKTLSYDELTARAVPIPVLGRNAYAIAPVHALLFACIHCASHVNVPYYVDDTAHFGGDRLIWLYDIHLLVSRMSAGELEDFAALATEKKIRSICGDTVRRTVECFATTIPLRVVELLGRSGPMEASARFLSGGRARQMLGDFLAFDRWSDRGGWVKELAFPSAGYMRSKYADSRNTWLPVLYARRALTGVARLMSSPHKGEGH